MKGTKGRGGEKREENVQKKERNKSESSEGSSKGRMAGKEREGGEIKGK